MTYRIPKQSPQPKKTGWLLKIILALLGGFVLFLMMALILVTVFSTRHRGNIYPGVTVAGINLSGLQPEQAVALLKTRIVFPETGKIAFQYGEKIWVARPFELGLYFDPENTALAAYAIGRDGNLITRLLDQARTWYGGVEIAPVLVYDQRVSYTFLDGISMEINQPVLEASLAINGTSVVSEPGRVGMTLDIPTTLAPLEIFLRNMTDGILQIIITETQPKIMDASDQAEIVRKILSAPVMLHIPEAKENDPPPWMIDMDALAGMIEIERLDEEQSTRYQISLNEEYLRSFLQNIAKNFNDYTENARFIFNDDTRQLELTQPAQIGRTLEIDANLSQIEQKIMQGEHDISLILEYSNPAAGDDASAESLGITELVSSHTSYFYGSSSERIQNIQTASARFHGLLVAPGETFSMGTALGDVSLDTGYSEALIIYGNRTIKGVGGGVCQVSTTLFRTAFFGGFPIVERLPHAYRVTYYELIRGGGTDTDLAGLDATVFVPLVDFKFINDTPNWLLMETYVNATARSLTWKFYSTSDGRKVDWETSGLQSIVEPDEPILQENPELAKNEIKQVDWEVAGADVTVTRTVYKDDKIYLEDTFFTHYVPWRAIYEYGPGSNLAKLMIKLDLVPMPN